MQNAICCQMDPVGIPLCEHEGTDVARKMIILGRECGLAVDMQSVKVQSLVPPQLAESQSADDFMAQLPQVTLWWHLPAHISPKLPTCTYFRVVFACKLCLYDHSSQLAAL